MSFLDRLLGRSPAPTVKVNTLSPPRRAADPGSDSVAVDRYRYLLRTAPPDELERAHVEAFERLTPDQRDIVRRDLEGAVPAGEAPRSTDPQDLARAATRAEVRAPGTLERAFGSGPAAAGMGGSFLQTFAAVFVATSIAQALFGGFGDPYAADQGAESSSAQADSGAGASDAGETGADAGGFGDSGDLGGFGGDFGGFDI